MADTVYIYALAEPDSGVIRYVGRSLDPRKRFTNHRTAGSVLVRDWFDRLASLGVRPVLIILDSCKSAVAPERERLWIERFAHLPLLNANDGAVLIADWQAARAITSGRTVRVSMGSALLSQKLTAWGAQARLSVEIGVKQSVISRWANGQSRPKTKARIELQERLGIAWDLWDQEAA